jgi:hypothetical protein
MTTEKRLIFITSDEQLVHEISLKKSKNTHIIDLDTGENISSTLSKHVRNKYIYIYIYIYIKQTILFLFFCLFENRIQKMMKLINNRKLQENQYALSVVIMPLDIIMMFFHVLHVKHFFIDMVMKI